MSDQMDPKWANLPQQNEGEQQVRNARLKIIMWVVGFTILFGTAVALVWNGIAPGSVAR